MSSSRRLDVSHSVLSFTLTARMLSFSSSGRSQDVIEQLSSPELVGGEDSLLGSDQVMVIPGYLDDASRPVLLALTKSWGGKEQQSFAKVMRQVKARLIEARGAIQVVVVFCDCWDSTSFEEEQREELSAFDQNGIRFLFLLVGAPDTVLTQVSIEFGQAVR
jgi:uncharacterized protein (DUF1501 family)